MKFIKQTRTGKGEGNCLCACIASLLEIDIDIFPNVKDEHGWQVEFNEWFLREHGHEVVLIDFQDREYVLPKSILIAVVNVPDNDETHAVLWQDGKLIFDPSPYKDRGILGKPKYYILLIKNYKERQPCLFKDMGNCEMCYDMSCDERI